MLRILFLLVFFFFNMLDAIHPPLPLKINLISCLNGKGLEADQNILADALEKLGHSVKKLQFQDVKKSPADINIFFQFLVPEKFSWATLNWLIPNPEWYEQEIELLSHIDLVLCRTHEIERIFQELHLVP